MAVAGMCLHVRDDVALRFHAHRHLVAGEVAGAGLTAVAHLGVNRGCDTVLGHPIPDGDASIVPGLDILLRHGCQEVVSSLGCRIPLYLGRLSQQGTRILDQIPQQLGAGFIVLPVDVRLAVLVVVLPHQFLEPLGLQPRMTICHAEELLDCMADQGVSILDGSRTSDMRGVEDL